MKKFLICIFIIVTIMIAIFLYESLTSINNNENFQPNKIVLSTDGDFLLYIDDVFDGNSNTKIVGNISNGSINVNDEISIVGLGKKAVDTKITKLEVNDIEVGTAKAGDKVGITLDSMIDNGYLEKGYLEKGQAVIITGSMKPIFNIEAKITDTNLDIKEIEKQANIFNINSDIQCSIKITSEEKKQIKISLDVPIVVLEGLEFVIKKDNLELAKGIIVK